MSLSPTYLDKIVGPNDDSAVGRRRVWPPPDLDVVAARIDYLAFRAAEPELRRRARSTEALIWRLLGSGWGRAARSAAPRSAEWREVADEKLSRYVSACYTVAERFNGEDRNVLRLSGALPIGFFDEVEKEVRRAADADRHATRRH